MKKYCLLLPRLRFIMKLSLLQIFISTALLSAVHANPGHGQNLLDRTVTLDIKNKPVKKVLAEIELLTHVKFAYRSDVVALNNRVNLEAQNEPLGQVLNRLLENKIACEIIGDQILLTAAHNFFYQDLQSIEDKSIAVTGKILDEKGEPLAGGTIAVKGRHWELFLMPPGNSQLMCPTRIPFCLSLM